MTTGIIRNFFMQAPPPAYFPMIFQHSPCMPEEDEDLLVNAEERENEEEREVEEEGKDEELEAQEEDEECLREIFSNPAECALDVTTQLLRFADVISRDVQQYFGHCSGDQEVCNIYSDSNSITTSGRLRYYDDLLRIAETGGPEEQESSFTTCSDDSNSGLGPLAELFDFRGSSQNRGQPMIKRHLPLSFWTEPVSRCSVMAFSNTLDVTHAASNTLPQHGGDVHMHYNTPTHQNVHTFDSAQPDFSDLLANWDPPPELSHTLPEDTHMQH
ncbi:uncharacterized protein percc1 [Pholidichthys leucotaenia]